MVAPRSPLGKADAARNPVAQSDPRVEAFADYCAAVDRRDPKRLIAVQRQLRKLGYVVAYAGPRGQDGGS